MKLSFSLTGPSHQLPQVTRDVFKVFVLFEKLLDKVNFTVGKQSFLEQLDNTILDNRRYASNVVDFMSLNNFQLSSEHIRQAERKKEQDNFLI